MSDTETDMGYAEWGEGRDRMKGKAVHKKHTTQALGERCGGLALEEVRARSAMNSHAASCGVGADGLAGGGSEEQEEGPPERCENTPGALLLFHPLRKTYYWRCFVVFM